MHSEINTVSCALFKLKTEFVLSIRYKTKLRKFKERLRLNICGVSQTSESLQFPLNIGNSAKRQKTFYWEWQSKTFLSRLPQLNESYDSVRKYFWAHQVLSKEMKLINSCIPSLDRNRIWSACLHQFKTSNKNLKMTYTERGLPSGLFHLPALFLTPNKLLKFPK